MLGTPVGGGLCLSLHAGAAIPLSPYVGVAHPLSPSRHRPSSLPTLWPPCLSPLHWRSLPIPSVFTLAPSSISSLVSVILSNSPSRCHPQSVGSAPPLTIMPKAQGPPPVDAHLGPSLHPGLPHQAPPTNPLPIVWRLPSWAGATKKHRSEEVTWRISQPSCPHCRLPTTLPLAPPTTGTFVCKERNREEEAKLYMWDWWVGPTCHCLWYVVSGVGCETLTLVRSNRLRADST
jgi:hypothetical protein